ncbi:MAG: hypothetical protein LBR12_06320 [Opitutaceae bacterium]|jgi:hypothetical protein|nr:hypothetical protein [Opitutaceae bacterium]
MLSIKVPFPWEKPRSQARPPDAATFKTAATKRHAAPFQSRHGFQDGNVLLLTTNKHSSNTNPNRINRKERIELKKE